MRGAGHGSRGSSRRAVGPRGSGAWPGRACRRAPVDRLNSRCPPRHGRCGGQAYGVVGLGRSPLAGARIALAACSHADPEASADAGIPSGGVVPLPVEGTVPLCRPGYVHPSVCCEPAPYQSPECVQNSGTPFRPLWSLADPPRPADMLLTGGQHEVHRACPDHCERVDGPVRVAVWPGRLSAGRPRGEPRRRLGQLRRQRDRVLRGVLLRHVLAARIVPVAGDNGGVLEDPLFARGVRRSAAAERALPAGKSRAEGNSMSVAPPALASAFREPHTSPRHR